MNRNTMIENLMFTNDRYQVVKDTGTGKMYYMEEVTDPVTFEDALYRYARRLLLSPSSEDQEGGLNLCSHGIDLGNAECARLLKKWYFPNDTYERDMAVLSPIVKKAFYVLLEKGTTEEKLEACRMLLEDDPEQVKMILRNVYSTDTNMESRAVAGILLYNMDSKSVGDLNTLVKLAYAKREVTLCSQFLVNLFSGPTKESIGYLDEKTADFVLRVMRLSGKQFVWLQSLFSFSNEYPWIESYVNKVQNKEKEREKRLQDNKKIYQDFINGKIQA